MDSGWTQVYMNQLVPIGDDASPFNLHENTSASFHRDSLSFNFFQGANSNDDSNDSCKEQSDVGEVLRRNQAREITGRLLVGPLALFMGCFLIYRADYDRGRLRFYFIFVLGANLVGVGLGAFFLPIYWQDNCKQSNKPKVSHGIKIVTQRLLTKPGAPGADLTPFEVGAGEAGVPAACPRSRATRQATGPDDPSEFVKLPSIERGSFWPLTNQNNA
jgi:hypothetical protein